MNKGWLYGLTKLKQLSLAHNQVCRHQHLQLDLELICSCRLTTLRTMDGTFALPSGNSTFRATRFYIIFTIIIMTFIITILIIITIIVLIFVNSSLRLLRGTSCVGCQVSPTLILGDHDFHDDHDHVDHERDKDHDDL